MPYPVFNIPPENVLESEQLGTKDKFWFRGEVIDGNEESEWLFKFPTEGTGQHWAEKIAYEIAREMRVKAPRVELAELEGTQGSATISFTKGFGYELYHGNQILHDTETKQNRERYLHDLGVVKYIERGRSPIFVTGDEKHGLAPIKLVKACLEIESLQSFFQDSLELLDHLNPDKFTQIISEFPTNWMSDLAKEFAISLLIETLEHLNQLRT